MAGCELASSSAALKRSFDLSAAALALILFAPLLLTVALLVLVAQGRPVFIRQKRVGKNGKLFSCFKYRTMTTDADTVLRAHLANDQEAKAEWDSTRKLRNDPRITPLGQVMRKLSVDEMPQLFNILRGEMSVVGPRPIVPDEVPFYGTHIGSYCSVRPGLTGIWQVNGRNDVAYAKRVQMDTDYVSNWSFGTDLSIIARTVPAVIRASGC